MPDTIDLHPEMKFLIDAKADLPPATTVAEMRAGWDAYAERLRQPYPEDMAVEDRGVTGKGGLIPIRVYRPAAAAATARASCISTAGVS